MTLIVTQPSNLGYLLVDHRASGQAPAGMPKLFEAATYTCTHCESVVVLNPERKRERYKCRGCNHLICDGCAEIRTAGAPCRTFRQMLDEQYELESRSLIL